jgi:hypothetical protein
MRRPPEIPVGALPRRMSAEDCGEREPETDNKGLGVTTVPCVSEEAVPVFRSRSKSNLPSPGLSADESDPVIAPATENYGIAIDAPITLQDACEMVFRGSITPASLRAEQRRGNLSTFKIGRTIFTTLHDLREMQDKCRVVRKDHASTSIKVECNGLSETDRTLSALAALNQTVKGLKSGSLNTSAQNTNQRQARPRR